MDGTPSSTDHEERTAVKNSFQAKFEAVDTTMLELITDERGTVEVKAVAAALVPKSLKALPTMSYQVCRHAHAKMNGTGEVVIGGSSDNFPHALLPRCRTHCRSKQLSHFDCPYIFWEAA